MPYSKYTPKQKRLAAMYGNKKKITRGDVIAAAKSFDLLFFDDHFR